MDLMLNGAVQKMVHAQNAGGEPFEFRLDGVLYQVAPGEVVYIPQFVHAHARREWGGQNFQQLDPQAGSTEYAKSEAQRAKREADEALEKAQILLKEADAKRQIAIEKGAIVDAVRAQARTFPGALASGPPPPPADPEGPPPIVPGPTPPPPAKDKKKE